MLEEHRGIGAGELETEPGFAILAAGAKGLTVGVIAGEVRVELERGRAVWRQAGVRKGVEFDVQVPHGRSMPRRRRYGRVGPTVLSSTIQRTGVPWPLQRQAIAQRAERDDRGIHP